MAIEDEPRVRALAKIPEQPRGVARVTAETGQRTGRIYWPLPEQKPVFVDDSGRRGRWMAWVSVLLAAGGLALIVVFWASQVHAAAA